MQRRTLATVSIAAAASLLSLTSCLPLRAAAAGNRCVAASSYAPAGIDSAPRVRVPTPFLSATVPEPYAPLLEQLTWLPETVSVSVDPVVTVRLAVGDGANDAVVRRLRAELGSAIDIEVGAKRLGGGPGAQSSACTLVAPAWAIAAPLPRGIKARTIVAPGVSRHRPFTAVVRVTNSSKRWQKVAADLQLDVGACGAELRGEALTKVGDGLAVNLAKGLSASDDAVGADWSALRPGSLLRRGVVDGATTWMPVLSTCPGRAAPVSILAPGATADIEVTVVPTSLLPDDDPAVAAGSYDIRASILLAPATAADVRAARTSAARQHVTAVVPTARGARSEANSSWTTVMVSPATVELTD